MEQIIKLKKQYSTLYSKYHQELIFEKAHEGKGLLNREITKLYKNKKYIKGQRHFEEIVVKCIAISEKMLKLKRCAWSEQELNEYVLNAFDYYQNGHDNSLADFYGGKGRLTSCDGHKVRSKSELIIDLWLVTQNIKHEYEKQVYYKGIIEVECDFYLPEYDCYIEYWGLEGDSLYEARKAEKIEFYKNQNLKLISLYSDDLKNLNETLLKKINSL